MILTDINGCYVRFKKGTCVKYFYPKVTVGKIYSELVVEKVEAKHKAKKTELKNKAEADKPEALTMNITNMYADGTAKILFSELIRPLSAINLTLD